MSSLSKASENIRAAHQIFTYTAYHSWKSMGVFCCVLFVLFLVVTGLNIVSNNGPLGVIIGSIFLMRVAVTGVAATFVFSCALVILYVILEIFWIRISVKMRVLVFLGLGLLFEIAMCSLVIVLFQPFCLKLYDPVMIDWIQGFAFLTGLALGGITALIYTCICPPLSLST